MNQWASWVAWLVGRNAVDVVAIFFSVFILLWLWRKSSDPCNTYDLSDTIKDSFTNKASAAALVYMCMAALSTWYIIREEVDGGDPVNALLAILSIFVVKSAADRGISAWGARAPEMAPPLPGASDPDCADTIPLPATVVTATTVSVKKGK